MRALARVEMGVLVREVKKFDAWRGVLWNERFAGEADLRGVLVARTIVEVSLKG